MALNALGIFTGGPLEDLTDFVDKFNRVGQHENWNDEQKRQKFPLYLDKTALSHYHRLTQAQRGTAAQGQAQNQAGFDVLVQSLRQSLETPAERQISLSTLNNLQQGTMSSDEFGDLIGKGVTKTFGANANAQMLDDTKKNYFLQGLRGEIKDRLRLNYETFAELLNEARGFEAVLRTTRSNHLTAQANTSQAQQPSEFSLMAQEIQGLRSEVQSLRNEVSRNGERRNQDKIAPVLNSKQHSQLNLFRPGGPKVCYYCDKPGHLKRECRIRKRDEERIHTASRREYRPNTNRYNQNSIQRPQMSFRQNQHQAHYIAAAPCCTAGSHWGNVTQADPNHWSGSGYHNMNISQNDNFQNQHMKVMANHQDEVDKLRENLTNCDIGGNIGGRFCSIVAGGGRAPSEPARLMGFPAERRRSSFDRISSGMSHLEAPEGSAVTVTMDSKPFTEGGLGVGVVKRITLSKGRPMDTIPGHWSSDSACQEHQPGQAHALPVVTAPSRKRKSHSAPASPLAKGFSRFWTIALVLLCFVASAETKEPGGTNEFVKKTMGLRSIVNKAAGVLLSPKGLVFSPTIMEYVPIIIDVSKPTEADIKLLRKNSKHCRYGACGADIVCNHTAVVNDVFEQAAAELRYTYNHVLDTYYYSTLVKSFCTDDFPYCETSPNREKRFLGFAIAGLLGLTGTAMGITNSVNVAKLQSKAEMLQRAVVSLNDKQKNLEKSVDHLIEADESMYSFLHETVGDLFTSLKNLKCAEQNDVVQLQEALIARDFSSGLKRAVDSIMFGATHGELTPQMVSIRTLKFIFKDVKGLNESLLGREPGLTYKFGKLYPIHIDLNKFRFAFIIEIPIASESEVYPLFQISNVGAHDITSGITWKLNVPRFVAKAKHSFYEVDISQCLSQPGLWSCQPNTLIYSDAVNCLESVLTPNSTEVAKKCMSERKIISLSSETEIATTLSGVLIRTNESKVILTRGKTRNHQTLGQPIATPDNGVHYFPYGNFTHLIVGRHVLTSSLEVVQESIVIKSQTSIFDPIDLPILPISWAELEAAKQENFFAKQFLKKAMEQKLVLTGTNLTIWNFIIIMFSGLLTLLGVLFLVFVIWRCYKRRRYQRVPVNEDINLDNFPRGENLGHNHQPGYLYTMTMAPLLVAVAVDGKLQTALFDTGANLSMISYGLCNEMGLLSKVVPQTVLPPTVSATGHPIPLNGCISLTLTGRANSTVHKFFVSPEIPYDAILGMDFAQQFDEINIKNKDQKIVCRRNGAEIFSLDIVSLPTSPIRSVGALNTVIIPPRSNAVLNGFIEDFARTKFDQIFEPDVNPKLHLHVGRSIVAAGNRLVVIQLLNVTNKPVKIFQGTQLGTVEPIEGRVSNGVNSTSSRIMKTVSGFVFNITKQVLNSPVLHRLLQATQHSLLTDIQLTKLTNFLAQNLKCFSQHEYDLGSCDAYKLRIETNSSTPIREKPRRIPHHLRENLRKELDGMLAAGIIVPSTSDWAAPIVYVPKKDGTWRLCVDYRRLNAVTKVDIFPLPRVQDILDMLNGSCWFTKLDMRKGFWQQRLEKATQHKSSFTSIFGQFEFTVVPFGLNSSPSGFQRCMEIVLSGLVWSKCLIYIDDVLVFSNSFEQHLIDLQEVFDRLSSADLKLNGDKCEFCKSKVTYLGHVISKEGIEPDQKLVSDIQNREEPKNLKELQSFLGLVVYYHQFVEGFSTIAGPLNALRKKDVPFVWSKDCQTAFDALKKSISTPPVLIFPDFSKRFILYTDASGYGLGAILSQETDSGVKPISFASRALQDYERRYEATEKEALAVKWSVEYFSHYLIAGPKFLVVTDHMALKWFLTSKTKTENNRLLKWRLSLSNYNFDVEYRPGKLNGNADALSRDPKFLEPEPGTCNLITGFDTTTLVDQVRDQQNDDAFAKAMKDYKLADTLPQDVQLTKLTNFLAQNLKCFSQHEYDLGSCDAYKLRIETNSSTPIREKPRRIPHHLRENLRKELDGMLAAGIIVPSTSDWAAPIVYVPKKDGTWRLCVDYRRLNAVTKVDIFPLPRVQDILDMLNGSCWFTKLDMRKGFWQQRLEKATQHKSSFTSIFGQFEFTVVPFGLNSSPSGFQRCMEIVLSGLVWSKCLIYIDDVLVFSNSFEQHLIDLQEVFDRLSSADLKLNGDKCEFCKSKVTYLGHVISKEGIEPDQKLVSDIQNREEPKNLKELQSFLGLVVYYHQFVEGFSTIAGPLNALRKKDVPFVWSKDCQTAFDALKKSISTPPVLIFPDFSKRFILYTDASGYGLGAILSQETDSGVKPISFASRALQDYERRYEATEKEALAVKWSVEYFSHYLIAGPKFLVVTDHMALKWFLTSKTKTENNRLLKWRLSLSNYNFDVEYRPGKLNGNADALSRDPKFLEPEPGTCNLITGFDTTTLVDQVRDQQNDDAFAKAMKDYKLADTLPQDDKFARKVLLSADAYHLTDEGILMHLNRTARGETAEQIYVPDAMRTKILKLVHSEKFSGHFGRAKTHFKLQADFYWPQSYRDVCRFINTCFDCMQRKNPRFIPKALLRPIPPSYPMERVHCDIVGPLPKTSFDNEYLLVFVCSFTKYVMIIPMPDQKAFRCAQLFVEAFVCNFGVPRLLFTDQGVQFTSKFHKEVCNLLGCDKFETTPYHPMGNGQVERQNRTIEHIMSMMVGPDQSDWDVYVPYVSFAMNTSVNATTGETPFYLLHGFDAKMPHDLSSLLDPERFDVNDYKIQLLQRMQISYDRNKAIIEKAQVKMKAQYDKNAVEPDFKQGQLVLVKRMKIKKGLTKKFAKLYAGPYRILDINAPDATIKLVGDPKAKMHKIHFNRLKPVTGPTVFPLGGEDLLVSDEKEPADWNIEAEQNSSD